MWRAGMVSRPEVDSVTDGQQGQQTSTNKQTKADSNLDMVSTLIDFDVIEQTK